MTPRTDVDWINLEREHKEIHARLLATSHSRLPVGQGTPDNMIGVVQVRELLRPLLNGEPLDIRNYVRRAPVVPDTLDALDALNVLRKAAVPSP